MNDYFFIPSTKGLIVHPENSSQLCNTTGRLVHIAPSALCIQTWNWFVWPEEDHLCLLCWLTCRSTAQPISHAHLPIDWHAVDSRLQTDRDVVSSFNFERRCEKERQFSLPPSRVLFDLLNFLVLGSVNICVLSFGVLASWWLLVADFIMWEFIYYRVNFINFLLCCNSWTIMSWKSLHRGIFYSFLHFLNYPDSKWTFASSSLSDCPRKISLAKTGWPSGTSRKQVFHLKTVQLRLKISPAISYDGHRFIFSFIKDREFCAYKVKLIWEWWQKAHNLVQCPWVNEMHNWSKCNEMQSSSWYCS